MPPSSNIHNENIEAEVTNLTNYTMFIKRARPRPAGRSREVDEDEPAGSPLAQDAGAAPDAGSLEDGAGSVMERKRAQRKAKQLGKGGKGTRLSFGGEEEVGLLRVTCLIAGLGYSCV